MSVTDKRMQILAYTLGVAHVVFGATKLLALPPLVVQFRGWQLPLWMMYFVGVAQLLGGVGLFIRNLRLPSSFAMALVMIGATVTFRNGWAVRYSLSSWPTTRSATTI